MVEQFVRKFSSVAKRRQKEQYGVQAFNLQPTIDLDARLNGVPFVPIHEHNSLCQACGRQRTLFMGVCKGCEVSAYFTPAFDAKTYLCWLPDFKTQDPFARGTIKNPAYAAKKWAVRVV